MVIQPIKTDINKMWNPQQNIYFSDSENQTYSLKHLDCASFLNESITSNLEKLKLNLVYPTIYNFQYISKLEQSETLALKVSLVDNIITSLVFNLKLKTQTQDQCSIVIRLQSLFEVLANFVFQNLKKKLQSSHLAFCLYSNTDNLIHTLSFPEIAIERDSYHSLIFLIKSSLDLKGSFLVSIEREILHFPLSNKSALANIIGFVSLKEPFVFDNFISIQTSSPKELLQFFSKYKKLNSAFASWLCIFIKESIDFKTFLPFLRALYTSSFLIPTINEIEIVLYKFETTVFEEEPCKNISYPPFLLNFNSTKNFSALDTVIKKMFLCKTNVIQCSIIHKRSQIYDWSKILTVNSEYYLSYTAVASLVDNLIDIKINSAYSVGPDSFTPFIWIKRKLKEQSLSDSVLLTIKPTVLSEVHNTLVSGINFISKRLSGQPYPLLHVLLEGFEINRFLNEDTKELNLSILSTAVYIFHAKALKLLPPSTDSKTTVIKQVCIFLKTALNLLNSDDEHKWAVDILNDIQLFSDLVISAASSTVSNGTLINFMIQREIFFNSKAQSYLEIYNENGQANLCPQIVDEQFEQSSKGIINFPVRLCFYVYSKYIQNSPFESFKSSFVYSMNHIYNWVTDIYETNERSATILKRFDPVTKVWITENELLYCQLHAIFYEFCIRRLVNNQSSTGPPPAKRIKQSSVLKAQMKLVKYPSVLYKLLSHDSKFEGKSMDANRYFLLMEDSSKQIAIYDVIARSLVYPTAEHRCSGRHTLALPIPFSDFEKILKDKKIANFVKLIFNKEAFGNAYKNALLGYQERFECNDNFQSKYKMYTLIYKSVFTQTFISIYPNLENYLTLLKEELEPIIFYFIYLCQICCHDMNYLIYMATRLSSLLLKVNNLRQCIFWFGDGKNGKTHLLTLIQRSLGTYACHTAQNIFSKHKSYNDSIRNTIFTGCLISTDELGDIDGDTFKALTSNGNFEARAIYQKPTSDIVRAHIIAAMNNPPKGNLDEAALGRIVCFPFKAKFLTENYPESIIKQLEKSLFPSSDTDIELELCKGYLFTAFHLLSLNLDKQSGNITLPELPECIKTTTNFIKEQSDSFRAFILASGLSESQNSQVNLNKVKNKIQEFCKTENIKQESHILKQFCTEYKDSLVIRLPATLYGHSVSEEPYSADELIYLILSNYEILLTKKSRKKAPNHPVNNDTIQKHILSKSLPKLSTSTEYDRSIFVKKINFKEKNNN